MKRISWATLIAIGTLGWISIMSVCTASGVIPDTGTPTA